MAEKRYTLYYNDYSVCSLMVRLTFAFGRINGHQGFILKEQPIDIHRGEQLSEFYLCSINPAGTVPVLIGSEGEPAFAESLNITEHLYKTYPHLQPTNVSTEIATLLRELHEITYFSLTYTKRPDRASDMLKGVDELLNASGISDKYRQALQYKRKVVERTRAPALDAAYIQKEESKASELMSKVTTLLESSAETGSPWIFGTKLPTALDAHIVMFVARLLDVGRENMVGPALRKYMNEVFEMDVWTELMQGKTTVSPSYRS